MPLLCKRGLPAKAQSFRRVSPNPPLLLSQTVGRYLNKEKIMKINRHYLNGFLAFITGFLLLLVQQFQI
jgi:hypothetical protein